MPTFHMMQDDDRSHRLCDNRTIELPLPHCTELLQLCTLCSDKADEIKRLNPDAKFGAAVSFAKQ